MKNISYMPEEPISAIATALAPSALAVIRVSGKNCIELVANLFSRPDALKKATGYTMVHGWIVNPLTVSNLSDHDDSSSSVKNTSHNRIDEVMLGVYRSPKSFTGEDMVEISCHGGTLSVLSIQKLLLQNGFRQAERGEFTFRAFLNGKTDLTRAEAVREIIDSKTDESRSRAAGRLSGNLYNEIERIKLLLINALGSLEAEVEYPEDEETISGAFDASQLEIAYDDLQSLSATWSSEKLYQDGSRVVLCGQTNAGKSSLFNILLKEERAIVSDIAGTTRDWLESWVSFDGIPVRLFDTAGLRETSDIIERSGVERSFDLARDGDVLLYLIDSTKGFTDDDSNLLQELLAPQESEKATTQEVAKKPIPIVLVWNKADIQTPEIIDFKQFNIVDHVLISAKTGKGLSSLTNVVKKILGGVTSSSRLQVGLGSNRQKVAVDEALDSIRHGLDCPSLGLGLDATVQDIEDAISFLGEITGEVSPTDVLENIFSRFCVGK